jgi:hypothetical protein
MHTYDKVFPKYPSILVVKSKVEINWYSWSSLLYVYLYTLLNELESPFLAAHLSTKAVKIP